MSFLETLKIILFMVFILVIIVILPFYLGHKAMKDHNEKKKKLSKEDLKKENKTITIILAIFLVLVLIFGVFLLM